MARRTGKLAALWLGAPLSKVGDLFEWSFEENGEMLNCSIKGDLYERFVASHGNARITAKRYLNTSGIRTAALIDAVNNNQQVAFRLDIVDADAGNSQLSGFAFMSRVTLTAPRGMVVEDFEMQVDGAWAITLPGPD
jgi:hypothetical protein